MSISRTISLICIVIGGCIAFYANANAQQNTYVLIAGIVLLMFGVYRISRNIPSKQYNDEETYVKSEDDDQR